MHVNSNTAVSTPNVLLVPYEPKHVPTYHEWMKDEDIQIATASEPLSMEQEFEMQRSWREDKDKLTFIICHPINDAKEHTPVIACDDEPDMIGDINLFLSESLDDPLAIVGELELMIAVKDARRRGFGKASLRAMLRYVAASEERMMQEFTEKPETTSSRIAYMKVKIGKGNVSSIGFFESMGFRKVSDHPDYFGEFELRLPWDVDHMPIIKGGVLCCQEYSEVKYGRES